MEKRIEREKKDSSYFEAKRLSRQFTFFFPGSTMLVEVLHSEDKRCMIPLKHDAFIYFEVIKSQRNIKIQEGVALV